MPTVTRTTTTRTTTSGVTGATRFHTIPLWSVKLITAILSTVVLILAFILPKHIWQYNVSTFIVVILTTGFLLGWSLPTVLGRFLGYFKVDSVVHGLIAALTVTSLVLCAIFLIDNNNRYHNTEEYRIFVGITVCIAVEAVICCVLAFWICFGSYTIIENR